MSVCPELAYRGDSMYRHSLRWDCQLRVNPGLQNGSFGREPRLDTYEFRYILNTIFDLISTKYVFTTRNPYKEQSYPLNSHQYMDEYQRQL